MPEPLLPGKATPSANPSSFLWTGFVGLGLLLSLVGLTDLALLLLPPRFGEGAWEFGIVSSVIDAMPVAVMGLSLLGFGAAGMPQRRLALAVSLVLVVGVLVLLALGLVYALNLPQALSQTPPQLQGVLRRSVAKTGVLGVSYLVYLAWLARFLRRHRS